MQQLPVHPLSSPPPPPPPPPPPTLTLLMLVVLPFSKISKIQTNFPRIFTDDTVVSKHTHYAHAQCTVRAETHYDVRISDRRLHSVVFLRARSTLPSLPLLFLRFVRHNGS